jgi:hypothetical protein
MIGVTVTEPPTRSIRMLRLVANSAATSFNCASSFDAVRPRCAAAADRAASEREEHPRIAKLGDDRLSI